MLTAGVLQFDAQGRVILSSNPPVNFNGGTPIALDGGLSGLTGGSPTTFLAAIGYTDTGQITDNTSPLIPRAGPITNDLGQVRVSNDPPTHWYAGLPITDDGHLSIAPVGPPPIGPGAFDQGFNNAFDNGSP